MKSTKTDGGGGMTCKNCGSTWSEGTGATSKLTACPFCGESLVVKEAPAQKVSVGEALRICVEQQTLEVLLNRSLVSSYLSDLATGFDSYEKFAITAAIDNGIADIFVEAEKQENPDKALALAKARRNMHEIFNEAKTQFVVDCFCHALSWERESALQDAVPAGDVADTLAPTAHGVSRDVAVQGAEGADEQPVRFIEIETIHVTELFDDTHFDEGISPPDTNGFFDCNPPSNARYWKIYRTYYDSEKKDDKKRALKEFSSPALFYHGPSAYRVGYMYENGIGTSPDPVLAREAYERAARAGNVMGVFSLSGCYFLGRGTAPDSDKAVRYLRFAAQRWAAASHVYAKRYETGAGTPVDLKNAEYYMKKADNAEIASNIALKAKQKAANEQNAPDKAVLPAEAVEAPKENVDVAKKRNAPQGEAKVKHEPTPSLATSGTKDAAELIGKTFVDFDNTQIKNAKFREIFNTFYLSDSERDKKRAFKKFDSIRFWDHGASANMVGYMYEKGIACEKYITLAINAYERAARAGLVEGVYNLGLCYLYGKGTNADEEKAFQYICFAAEHNLKPAALALAELYENGIGTQVDVQKAAEWANKAK